jgi:hypothetical protein
MRCCLHCFIDYDKAVVPVKICLKSSIYCFFLSPHHMAAGHAQPHFCYTCSSPKRIASSISILYKNRGFPFRLSTFEFIPERKPLDDRLARKHSSESPTRFVIPAKPQRVSDRERSCRACGAFPVCSDNNLRCERYSDITVLSTLTPLESGRMLHAAIASNTKGAHAVLNSHNVVNFPQLHTYKASPTEIQQKCLSLRKKYPCR